MDAEASAVFPPRSGIRTRRQRLEGRALDLLLDARAMALATGPRLDRAGASVGPRSVAVLGVYGATGGEHIAAVLDRLTHTRHDVCISLGALAEAHPELASVTSETNMQAGKFANLNRLGEAAGAARRDWVLLIDDDVEIGSRFLDRALLLAERFRLQLAQPALRRSSHTAWDVTRRRAALVRITPFVEIGPVTLLSGAAFRELTPFPDEGMGWGLDLHWAAIAKRLRWRLGVLDAVPVRHDLRPPAAGYRHSDAMDSARKFLESHEHLTYAEADRAISSHGKLP